MDHDNAPGEHAWRQQAGLAALGKLAVTEPIAQPPGRHRGRPGVSVAGVLIVAATIAAGAAVVVWPPARVLVYAAWMMPVAEIVMLTAGQLAWRWRFEAAPDGKFTEAVIQITTTGAERHRVTEIITQIRSYRLRFACQIWVVLEPGHSTDYPAADRVLVVPPEFHPASDRKARALEYSRRVRSAIGLDRADVKVIFNDDDVTLTRGYIETAFTADYDVCEGIVTPRTEYATQTFAHFIASHADDIRTHACLVYCSVFQGILRRPLHVHGEGMVVTGEAERVVTWDWPVTASEDLVFGHRAAKAGLRWGWFHEYAEVTSPWSIGEFLVQRRRWLWGDIHAIRHRDVLGVGSAAAVAAKYIAGMLALVLSASGLYLRVSGTIPATDPVFMYTKLAIVAWIALFFACGWIAASTGLRTNDSRLLAGLLAVVAAPASLLLTFAAIAVPLIQGDPRTFAVIRKTR